MLPDVGMVAAVSDFPESSLGRGLLQEREVAGKSQRGEPEPEQGVGRMHRGGRGGCGAQRLLKGGKG